MKSGQFLHFAYNGDFFSGKRFINISDCPRIPN